MAAICAITKLMEEVKAERRRYSKELNDLDKSTTFFKRFKHAKQICRARIETLDKVYNWLAEDLRTAKIMNENEL